MGRVRILIVDDEEDLVSALAERLALREFEVGTAITGDDALRQIEQRDFDVLLVDVKMPGLSGLQLLAEVKRGHPDLPVLLFTGLSSVADAEKGLRAGAHDYLVKPIDIDALIEKIDDAANAGKG